jgi:hypothetical protein
MVAGHRLVEGERLEVVERAGLRLVGVDPVDPGPGAAGRRLDVAAGGVLGSQVIGDRLDGVGQARQRLELGGKLAVDGSVRRKRTNAAKSPSKPTWRMTACISPAMRSTSARPMRWISSGERSRVVKWRIW